MWMSLKGALILLFLITGILPEALAQSAESYGYKRKEGFSGRGNTAGQPAHIQLPAMMASIRRDSNSLSTVQIPVTIVLSLKSRDQLGPFCRLTPRVRDALILGFSRESLTLDYLFDPKKLTARSYRLVKTEKQKMVSERLITAINKTVGDAPVVDILLIKGAMRLGSGGTTTRLPFSSVLGCVEVEEEEKAKARSEAQN